MKAFMHYYKYSNKERKVQEISSNRNRGRQINSFLYFQGKFKELKTVEGRGLRPITQSYFNKFSNTYLNQELFLYYTTQLRNLFRRFPKTVLKRGTTNNSKSLAQLQLMSQVSILLAQNVICSATTPITSIGDIFSCPTAIQWLEARK